MCIRDRYQRRVRGTSVQLMACEELFQQIDCDGDGTITKTEFHHALTGKRKQRLRQMFSSSGLDWRDVYGCLGADSNQGMGLKEFQARCDANHKRRNTARGPSNLVEAWDDYFSAFGAQSVEEALVAYTADSTIRTFDHRTGVSVNSKGTAEIKEHLERMFSMLTDTSSLCTRLVEVTEAPERQVYLVWSCASAGVVSATETFFFSEDLKITRWRY
eukprot:TRINITY_DN2911_c0_g1_i2.p1 TRINITY_DN2911_c0_g1~~TRINITY_DN2911_c0_g1_i2.p1  ORF type:complete len:216 (-),score=49.00 TRINITY_DN2911_c0_g1_i2:526-1173(-)